ncbi:hypothetical protein [Facklamia sp. P13055]|uniref:hypothetical protein n=1 Tax=Facklamia sp. P13055 TaxID=3421952 RepID=UPI003D166A28
MKAKDLVTLAHMMSLSIILAQFKLFLTVAFDSSSAFILLLAMRRSAGAIVGAIGHLTTAMSSAFPLSIPLIFY